MPDEEQQAQNKSDAEFVHDLVVVINDLNKATGNTPDDLAEGR